MLPTPEEIDHSNATIYEASVSGFPSTMRHLFAIIMIIYAVMDLKQL